VERAGHCPTPVKHEAESRASSTEPRSDGFGPRGALLHAPDPRDVDDADPDIIPCLYGKWIRLNSLERLHTFVQRRRSMNVCLTSTLIDLIPLSGVGITCFSSCCDKDSAIIFTTGRLPDINPP
jgi:hypothetical protein